MTAASNLVPSFAFRRALTPEELVRLDEPVAIYEGEHVDTDGETAYVYTVAGWLGGHNVATEQGGCTVGGEAMIVHGISRAHADVLVGYGLQDTIEALKREQDRFLDAQAALARLQTIGRLELVDQAMKPAADKSDAFVNDIDKVRPLVGDDIVLATGGVKH